MAVGDGQVDQVSTGPYLVELLSLDQPDQLLCGKYL